MQFVSDYRYRYPPVHVFLKKKKDPNRTESFRIHNTGSSPCKSTSMHLQRFGNFRAPSVKGAGGGVGGGGLMWLILLWLQDVDKREEDILEKLPCLTKGLFLGRSRKWCSIKISSACCDHPFQNAALGGTMYRCSLCFKYRLRYYRLLTGAGVDK